MKILIIGSLTNISGSSLRNWEIANAFAKIGHEVTYTEPVIQITQIGPLYPTIKYIPTSFFNLPLFMGFIPSFFYNSLLLIKNHYNLIIVAKPFPHSSIPMLLFGKNAIKIIDIDDLEFEYHKGAVKFAVKTMTSLCIKLTPYYSSHNYPLINYLSKKFSISTNKILFLGQGVNPETFSVDKTSITEKYLKKFNIRQGEIVILFFAHLGPASTLSVIFKSITKIKTNKKFKLLVVGGGPYLKKYQKESQKLLLTNKVIFVGHVDFQKRSEYFHLANFALNYNVDSGNEFRSPMKLREYLASGLPVITTNIGDTKLFSKYIKIVKNEKDLTTSLQKWINNLPAYNSSGKNFVTTNYSWEKIASNFIYQVNNIPSKQFS